MNIDQRVRITLGDLMVQLCIAQAQIEELQAQLEALKKKPTKAKP